MLSLHTAQWITQAKDEFVWGNLTKYPENHDMEMKNKWKIQNSWYKSVIVFHGAISERSKRKKNILWKKNKKQETCWNV